ncbi:MAG: Asd/ArgC dimerization domain-containing protein [Thermoanaerobaculia bacterium]
MNPKHASGYRIGIVNPLTLVGNEIMTVLRDRSFPFAKVVLLDSTGAAAGAITDAGDEPAIVTAISDDELEDCDVVFFCGPAAGNREWIERHEDDGFIAIDLSQPSTADDGRLAIAGLNLENFSESDRVIVSPHPIAVPIALILHQIQSASPVVSCTAAVIQPASEFDKEGIEELAQQTISVLNIQRVPQTVFDRQAAFNLYPAPIRNEELIVGQIRSVLDSRVELALFVTQGTVFHSHTFSLFVKTRQALQQQQVVDALRRNQALAFAEGDQQFGTIDAAGRDEVLIAEVRPDPSIEGGFWVWAVCDNLRRSAALNAVLVAEKVIFGAGAPN